MTATPREPTRLAQVPGDDRDQLVAVADLAAPVDGDHPVAVTVEGEADRRPGGDDAGGQLLGMGRAAAFVDVAAVRIGGQRLDGGPEPLEDRGCGAEGGTVGAVEDHVQAAEVDRKGALELAQIVVERALKLARAPDPGLRACSARAGGDVGLDRLLLVVGQLAAVAGEELDPVVLPGVVRGRDHRRQVEAMATDENRRGGRRQHPGDQGVAAGLGDSGGEARLEHRPGLARVANDQDLRVRRVAGGGGGAAQRHGQLGRHDIAGDAADAVGSEQPLGHRSA